MKTERRHDIDWLRVIAIGLLLIYHIAIVFQPWAMFIGFIRSEEPLQELWIPMSMLNVWRIPFLFFVSGMGVYFAIRKRNWGQLLLERGRRIGIPLVFGFLAITPLHFLLFQGYYHMPLSYFPHLGHLWFLANILAYVVLLSPVFFYLRKRPDGRVMHGVRRVVGNPIGLIALSGFFILEVLLVGPQLFEQYAETWHGFFIGLLAFFFGFVFVASGKVFWQTVLQWRWLFLGMALLLYAFRLLAFELRAPGYLMAVESNLWIFAVFGFGYKYLNQPSALLRYLSQAAYPVYIIHMFVLYGGAMLLLPLQIPVILKFATLVAFTLAGCYLIYEFIIRRVAWLRPLFGLKAAPINSRNKSVAA
jgi:peptidoglycan/LPS O-acetylase OafA/YrhL